jgi:hypothetical protein
MGLLKKIPNIFDSRDLECEKKRFKAFEDEIDESTSEMEGV